MKDPTFHVFLAVIVMAVVVFACGWISQRAKEREREGTDFPAPPPLPEGKVITWPFRGFDLVGILLFSMLFFLSALSDRGGARLNVNVLLSGIVMQFFLAGMAVLAMAFRVKISRWLGLCWSGWRWVFLIAPAAVAALWACMAALQMAGYAKWMEALGVEAMQDTVRLLQESQDPLVLGLMAAAAVLVAPVCEEIVFRGYLYGASKKFAGGSAAAVFSALVFSSAHGSLAAFFPLFLVGLVLVLLYEKTGSLWAPVAVHLCFNGGTVAVQFAARAWPELFFEQQEKAGMILPFLARICGIGIQP